MSGVGDAHSPQPRTFRRAATLPLRAQPEALAPPASIAVEEGPYSYMHNTQNGFAASLCGEWREELSHLWGEEEPEENDDESEPEDLDDDDSESTSSDDFDHPCGGRCSCGLRQWNPDFYKWFMGGIGTTKSVVMFSLLAVFSAAKFELSDIFEVGEHTTNKFSIIVVGNLCSLIIGVSVSFGMEGLRVAPRLFSWHPIWRFAGISVLFTLASWAIFFARECGVSPSFIVMVGYVYLPMSALISLYFFKDRKYGKLEWLAMGMMMLAAACFIQLRERHKPGGVYLDILVGLDLRHIQNLALICGSIVASVVGSVCAEAIFKDRAPGLTKYESQVGNRFYVQKVHLDLASLLVSVLLWVLPASVSGSSTHTWFGHWRKRYIMLVVAMVFQGWFAGLVTKHFSTVAKSVCQSLVTIISFSIGDKVLGDKYEFSQREVPSLMLALIVLLSALIFQTGRFNFVAIKRRFEPKHQAQIEEDTSLSPPARGEPLLESAEEEREDEVAKAEPRASLCGLMKKYSSILLYILADAWRNLLNARANQTGITPTSMPAATYAAGVALFCGMLLCGEDGVRHLKDAWRPRMILKCMPCGFFFALALALGAMSYSQGATASTNIIVGKVYTPIAAFASRFILGRFYMWLEWFALIITTIALVAFGYMQTQDPSAGSKPAPMSAMLLIVLSATCSVFASLIIEKILKGERIKFEVVKVRLDMASLLWSILLLPGMGLFAQVTAPLGHSRQQDPFWTERPLGDCHDRGCEGPLGSNHTCASPACTCTCGSGVFVAWSSLAPPGYSPDVSGLLVPVVFLALAANVFQGWFGARVAYQFSTVDRAIADSFSLLMVYFLGDPLLNSGLKALNDSALNMVAFIVPLSAATFMVATMELERVYQLIGLDIGGSKRKQPPAAAPSSSNEDSEDSEASEG